VVGIQLLPVVPQTGNGSKRTLRQSTRILGSRRIDNRSPDFGRESEQVHDLRDSGSRQSFAAGDLCPGGDSTRIEQLAPCDRFLQ
jgi:hypothetical protein